MRFILLVAVWLAAATTIAFGQRSNNGGGVIEIRSGIEFARSLADAAGAETLLLVNDYTVVTEADFAGFDTPIILQHNRTIAGRFGRWATLNATSTRNKLQMANGVTLTMRWVVMLEMFGDVSTGAAAMLLKNMPGNETGTLSMEHAAYTTPFCYPPIMIEGFLGQTRTVRPAGYPGVNSYNVTVDVPQALMAMGGGLGAAPAVSPGSEQLVACSNDSRAPPMRRCWGHVAYLENFAVVGVTYDASRVLTHTGYYGYIVDTYMLCGALLPDWCILSYTAYGCLQQLLSLQAASAGGSGNTSGGGSDNNGSAAAASPGNDTSVATRVAGSERSSVSPASSGGWRTDAAPIVGMVVGGFAVMAATAVFAVITVRRRRQRRRQDAPGQQKPCSSNPLQVCSSGDGSSSGASPEDGYGSMPRESPAATGGGGASSAEAASTGAKSSAGRPAAVTVAAAGAPGSTAATATTPRNSSDCDMDIDLAARRSRTHQGASPVSSDRLSGLDGKPSVPDVEKGATGAGDRGSNPSGSDRAPPAHPRQGGSCQRGELQQQDEGGGDSGHGGAAAAPDPTNNKDVVVTPFTPLRPDLQLWQDPAQKVTLLPVVRGKGSYGKVCEGLYGGQRVAVKLVRDMLVCSGCGSGGSGGADKIVTTFAQEVEVLGRCAHPNVVRLLAACMQPPRFCLVMELMETSLQRLVFGRCPGRLLPLPKVLHIGCEIARGLEYLHPTIVHRDLKPDNVLISNADSPEPIVKISDFGLSRLRCTVSPTMHPEAGTPSYMAPECFDLYVSCITHHVDIYSWAVIMWTMLTGVEPWTGCGVVEIAYRVTLLDERLVLDETVVCGRCPPRLQRLLSRCWTRTPERRPAAAEVVKEMLLIMQQHERSGSVHDLDSNYMASPGSVLSRIREYQDAAAAAAAAAAATTTTTTAAVLADGTAEHDAGPAPTAAAAASNPADSALAPAAAAAATSDAVGGPGMAVSAASAAAPVLSLPPFWPPPLASPAAGATSPPVLEPYEAPGATSSACALSPYPAAGPTGAATAAIGAAMMSPAAIETGHACFGAAATAAVVGGGGVAAAGFVVAGRNAVVFNVNKLVGATAVSPLALADAGAEVRPRPEGAAATPAGAAADAAAAEVAADGSGAASCGQTLWMSAESERRAGGGGGARPPPA